MFSQHTVQTNDPVNLRESFLNKQEVLFLLNFLSQTASKVKLSSLVTLTFHDDALNDVVPLKEQPFVAENNSRKNTLQLDMHCSLQQIA